MPRCDIVPSGTLPFQPAAPFGQQVPTFAPVPHPMGMHADSYLRLQQLGGYQQAAGPLYHQQYGLAQPSQQPALSERGQPAQHRVGNNAYGSHHDQSRRTFTEAPGGQYPKSSKRQALGGISGGSVGEPRYTRAEALDGGGRPADRPPEPTSRGGEGGRRGRWGAPAHGEEGAGVAGGARGGGHEDSTRGGSANASSDTGQRSQQQPASPTGGRGPQRQLDANPQGQKQQQLRDHEQHSHRHNQHRREGQDERPPPPGPPPEQQQTTGRGSAPVATVPHGSGAAAATPTTVAEPSSGPRSAQRRVYAVLGRNILDMVEQLTPSPAEVRQMEQVRVRHAAPAEELFSPVARS
jgi:hypothetical protein